MVGFDACLLPTGDAAAIMIVKTARLSLSMPVPVLSPRFTRSAPDVKRSSLNGEGIK